MMDPGGGGRFQRGGGGGGKLLGWFHSVFLVMESCLCFHALKQQSRSPSILASDPKWEEEEEEDSNYEQRREGRKRKREGGKGDNSNTSPNFKRAEQVNRIKRRAKKIQV